jgi:hypothetical protein
MQSLFQPESSTLSIPYQPDSDSEITENPPRFTWMPVNLDDVLYKLQIADTADFVEEQTKIFEHIQYNMFTPPEILNPGTYCWRYTVDDADYEWSKVRSFIVPEDLPETPLLPSSLRYESAGEAHPHLWLSPQGIEDFRGQLSIDANYCEWQIFFEKSVLLWKEHELIPEPSYYTDGKRTPKEWRKMYMDCQEALYAVRHLSIAGIFLVV